jgi:hypothetical protein
VNHAKRTGRGLKVIKSGEEWRTLQEAINLGKEINDPSDEEEHSSDEEDHPSDENDPVLVGADDTVPDKNTKDTSENGKEEAEIEALKEHVDDDDDDVSVESCSGEESSFASSDDDSAESDTSIPDIDDVNADWKLPELRDYLGGDEVAEKVVFFIHAISVASVGLLLSLAQ